MKVENMTSARGNTVPNQFIIHGNDGRYFQSYRTMIVFQPSGFNGPTNPVQLDAAAWDYSVTTGRYRNQFLGEGIKATRAKIASGEYVLTDLN